MRGPSFRATAVLITAFAATPSLLMAQAVQTVTLSQPDAQFTEPFDQVTAIRELRDGRVVVSDLFAKTVSVVDLRTGSATAIGREGQGPGEYAFPGGLVALPGDTTLVVDPAQRRFLKIGPDLKPVGTISFPEGVGGIVSVKGADRQGRVYFQGSPFRGGPLGGPRGPDAEIPDSVALLRWHPAGKSIDSLGRIKIPAIARATSGTANARAVIMRPQPFSPSDDWSVTPEGRIGIARVGDYHVEWLGAPKVAGPAVRAARVPVTKGDKDEFGRRSQDPRGRVTIAVGGNAAGRGDGAPVAPQLPEPDWPEFKPPFVSNSVVAAPDGQLWVERSQPAGAARLYDVFDAQGRLVRQVRLAPRSRVVGFGATSVYVAQTDADDLQVLQRFRRPA